MRMATIYCSPLDHPGKWVVREHLIYTGEAEPTVGALLGVADDVEQARALVPPELDYALTRSPDDHLSVVETWL